ncbi:phytase esterase-like protein, partial [Amnimonas aquatica]
EKVKYPHDKMEGLWVINSSTLGVINDDDFALWVNPVTFALQQKYLDSANTVFDGNTLYVIDGLDLKPLP